MISVSTARCRHSKYYLAKLDDLNLRYQMGGQDASDALTGFMSEWEQCKRGQSYAAKRIDRDDWDADLSLRYAVAGALFLSLRFPPGERIEWLESGLRAAKRVSGQRELEAEIWWQLGSAYDALGDWKTSIDHYRESLIIVRDVLKNRAKQAQILGSLGLAYIMLGDKDEAEINLEKALEIAREVGDRRAEGRHLGSLGLISSGLKSISYFDEALAIARAVGDREGEISHLGCLGMVWSESGENLANTRDLAIHPNIIMRNRRPDGSLPKDLEDRLKFENSQQSPFQRAANYFREAVTIARETGDKRAEARQLGNLGRVLAKDGDMRTALGCYREALAISEQMGDHQNQVRQLEDMKSAYKSLNDKKEEDDIEARLKEISNRGAQPDSANLINKFGTKGVDPFHEEYWRASREEDIKKYWSEYYQSHLRG
jgi:tetratricopeptide (TPR) repeat protein